MKCTSYDIAYTEKWKQLTDSQMITSNLTSYLFSYYVTKNLPCMQEKAAIIFENVATFRKIRTEKEAFSLHSIEILISLFTVLYGPKGEIYKRCQ